MVKKILVFNVGSSTIKFSIFNEKTKILEGKYENLKTKKDYAGAFNRVYQKIKNKKIELIIHRVVHGGDAKKPLKINKNVKQKIKEFSKFAPLHNKRELLIINLAEKFNKPQYAVFDTSFFVNLPKISTTYPIPSELIKKYKIKKYGFHGLSHESVSRGINGKTITCHLGAGVSMTAIKNKKPIDTSMGLTPLEGLMMGTRSGTIDPGLIIFLQKKGYDVGKILNFKSGFKGLCNYSDFRDILKNLNKKNVKLTYEIFVYQIVKYIGAYTAELNGLDNLIFTGAIGENVPKLREDICKHLDFLKIKLDKSKNIKIQKNFYLIQNKNFEDKKNRKFFASFKSGKHENQWFSSSRKSKDFREFEDKKNKEIISSDSSKVKVYVKKANEDEIMVREVMKIL